MQNTGNNKVKGLMGSIKKERKNSSRLGAKNNKYIMIFFIIMTIGYIISFILPLLPEAWISNRKWLSIPAACSAGSVWLITTLKFKEQRDHYRKVYVQANAYIRRAKFQLSEPPTDSEIQDLARDWNDQLTIFNYDRKNIKDFDVN